MARPSRTAMYADDGTFLWKAILRFLAILLAIVGIATTAWAMLTHLHDPSTTDSPYSTLNDYGDATSYFDYAFLPWQFITLGLSMLWNIANLSTLLARNRFIHPGANVACDLLLWLGLLITGGIATIGGTNFLYYSAYDDNSYYDGSGYGGGTYSNGTQYEYTANGTIVPVTDQCGQFATCDARDQFVSAVQHKGVVIEVGAAMAFVVLLFHFALFISACRYTHERRHSVSSRQARAITAEATEIARRMVAELTGPNGGGFIPTDKAQHEGGTYQPLQQREAGEAVEMRQQQPSRTQPGYDYAPVQQGEADEGQGQVLPRRDLTPRRHEPTAPGSTMGESSAAAGGRGKQRADSGPNEEIHPALRNGPEATSHAMSDGRR